MNLIASGGPDTKYTKGNTRDSLILAINTRFIDGIELKVYITRDNILTAAGPEALLKIGLTEQEISNITFDELKKYNIGNKVKQQRLIDLREVFSVFNTSRDILLLNLIDAGQKNSILVDKLRELTTLYPNVNLYLETDSDEILDYLVAINVKGKKGQIVNSQNINNLDVVIDFYNFNYDELNVNIINNLYLNNKDIFISNVNTREALIDIYNKFPDKFQDFYIISNNVALINAAYIINLQNKTVQN